MNGNTQLGSLFLIPIPIAEGALHTLSQEIATTTLQLKHYFVEDLRTARRFLRQLHPKIVIDDLHFSEIDKHTGVDTNLFKKWLLEGHQIGIMSEAGCPAVADPGATLVAIAQDMGATVVPLVGPNSLLLALMASGLNGQSFCFRGYLPVKTAMRCKAIKDFETISVKDKQTQLFIETPYRNDYLLEDILKSCQAKTRLCIAQNITAANSYIKTKTIENWKKEVPTLGKMPVVFLLLG